MQVREAMSTEVVTVGPTHTLREAAQVMARRRVGSAVVLDGERGEPGIITERDILDCVGAGGDVDRERVGEHLTADIVVAAPSWPIDSAALAMVDGNFRHLVVCEGSEVVGMLSVRDVIRVWARERNPGQQEPAPA